MIPTRKPFSRIELNSSIEGAKFMYRIDSDLEQFIERKFRHIQTDEEILDKGDHPILV